jgi:hypothetical protein
MAVKDIGWRSRDADTAGVYRLTLRQSQGVCGARAVKGDFGQVMPPAIAACMRQTLLRLGVIIRDQTSVTEVRGAEVLTGSWDVLPHDVCLWTGGFSVPALAHQAGPSVNARSQIVSDPCMRSVSHPEVYAVRDAAHPRQPPGVAVRMAAYIAALRGPHGADCVAASLRGKQPRPFCFAYVGCGCPSRSCRRRARCLRAILTPSPRRRCILGTSP